MRWVERARYFQIFEDVLRLLEGLLRVDHPLLSVQGREAGLPGLGGSAFLTAPREGQVALRIAQRQARKGEAPEAA
jgi:hypothetical protein